MSDKSAAQGGLVWTREKPAVPGWYWYGHRYDGKVTGAELAEVCFFDGVAHWWFPDDTYHDSSRDWCRAVSEYDVWAGPLTPPPPPDAAEEGGDMAVEEVHSCLACPTDVRDLYAVAFTLLEALERGDLCRIAKKSASLRRSVDRMRVIVDAHFKARDADEAKE